MALKIVDARPPNFDEILRVLPSAMQPGVLFTYGTTLYAPGLPHIEPWLMAHEEVHSARHAAACDVEAWWRRYLVDKTFRFEEELPAHREEWRVIRELVPSRAERRFHLKFVAQRLAGPLYGNIVTLDKARRLIVNASGE